MSTAIPCLLFMLGRRVILSGSLQQNLFLPLVIRLFLLSYREIFRYHNENSIIRAWLKGDPKATAIISLLFMLSCREFLS